MLRDRNGEREVSILGIVRDKQDPTEWAPFTDEETALHAGLDDIVFGKTLSECAATLNGKFPAADPRLTRLRQHDHGYYDSKGRWRNKAGVKVLPEDQQFYDGDDQFEALALVKKFGSIRCELERRNYGKHDPVKWAEEGCITAPGSRGYNSTIHEIRYNPKGVLRALKAAKTRAQNAPVRCIDISQAIWPMRNIVREHIPSLSYEAPDGKYSRYSVCWLFLETIKYFSFVFGPHSYRKHPEFRKLKLLWKARSEQSRKAFLDSAGCYRDVVPKFCNFMDHEIRIRNGKLIDRKGDWKPRGVFRDFHEFTRYAYAAVLNAHKKEEAAKAKAKAKAKRARSKSRSS